MVNAPDCPDTATSRPILGTRFPFSSISPSLPPAPAAAALACAGGFAVVYAPVLAGLARQWWTDPDYSHGLLCAPLAVGLAIGRRRSLAAAAKAPRTVGLAFAVASLLLLVVGRLGAELFLTRASLVGVLAGAVVFLLGWRHLRMLAFPFALLLLSIPLPAVMVTQVTLPLQLVASASAEVMLNAAAIPVLRDGNVLVLPNATLQVAEACSGIRSLVALFAAALIGARLAEDRIWARAAILAMALPVAVLMNAVRVVATAAGTYWLDPRAVEGLAHEALGFATFALAIGLLASGARVLRGLWPPETGLAATS